MLRLKDPIHLPLNLMVIRRSQFFDSIWYKRTYLQNSKVNPIFHFLVNGDDEAFDPSPNFSTSEYYIANPDVKSAGMNALLHYELFGKHEGREIIRYDRLLKRFSLNYRKMISEPYTRKETKKSNIKIFIACKEKSYVPDNSLFYPIQTGATLSGQYFEGMNHDDQGDNISERNEYYCELTAQYWVWKNIDADYYGFFHNRRYLSFNKKKLWEAHDVGIEFDTIDSYAIDRLCLHEDQMREVIEGYDVIVPRPFNWLDQKELGINRTVLHQYEMSKEHYITDLMTGIDILKKRHPDFSSIADHYLRSYLGYQMNMYIMRKNIFFDYCEWIFPVLDEIYETLDLSNRSQYGKRAIGFIGERLLGIYLTYLYQERPNLRIWETQNSFFKSLEPPILTQRSSNDKKDIKIFVSHRIDLESETIDNPLYYPVRCGAVFDDKPSEIPGDDTGDNISEKRESFNELTVLYWAWKNVKADYYGLCHYRRYQSFSSEKFEIQTEERNNGCVSEPFLTADSVEKYGLNEENMRKVIEQYDIILSEPISLTKCSLAKDNYAAMKMSSDYHNMDDVDKALEIVKAKYPHMADTVDRYMSSSISRLYNCFIMKDYIFDEYCSWLFDILFELEKQLDMSYYSTKMYRTPGTIGERLFGIYCLYLYEQEKYKIKETQLVFFENTEKDDELFPVFKTNQVTIVSNFNNNYAPFFATFLLSAMRYFSSENNYEIIVLTQDIEKTIKKQIENMISECENIVIRYYNPKRYLSTVDLPIYHSVYSEELYFRIIVPYVLKNYDKALVIDVDTICKSDLRELFEIDIKGFYAAGVRDTVFQGYLNGAVPGTLDYVKHVMKLQNPYDYINTGVILMNLKEIRKAYTLEDTIKVIRTGHFRIYEQDIINILYDGHIKFLDQSWNLFTYTNNFIGLCIDTAPLEANKLYKRARNEPKLIHYAAHPKPWVSGEADFSVDFWEVTRKSPFYELIVSRMVDVRLSNLQNALLLSYDQRGLKIHLKVAVDKLFSKGTRRRELLKKILPERIRHW